jgi:hypothetical protein
VLVSASSAFADCAANLGINFTPNQRIALCKEFGSAISQSLIPAADNTYDLGSATKTWRTLYTGTSRIAKTSDILRVRQDAQRLFTWDASSDTALTQTFGDGGTTAAQALVISGSQSDADDDGFITIAGGGGAAVGRGSSVVVQGNEAFGAGDLTLNTGDSAGSSAFLNLGNASGAFAIRNSAAADILNVGNNSAITAGLRIFPTSTVAALNIGDPSAYFAANYANSFRAYNSTGPIDGSFTASTGLGGVGVGSVTNHPIVFVGNNATIGSWSTAGALTTIGTLTSSATGSLGWSVVAAANQACTTTCTSAAMGGQDTGTNAIVGPSDATADLCFCAGAS